MYDIYVYGLMGADSDCGWALYCRTDDRVLAYKRLNSLLKKYGQDMVYWDFPN